MGLSFHYNGRFNSNSSLKEMVSEVEDIARIYNWKYAVHNTDFPEEYFGKDGHDNNIYGISVTPPESETLSLCFLANRRMSCSSHLEFYGDSLDEERRQYLYVLSVKTQYAGSKIHMMLIQLLRYIGKKYLQELNVIDEGLYWETNDEEQLVATFKKYNALLDNFSTAVESFPANEGETTMQYFERLIAYVNKKM